MGTTQQIVATHESFETTLDEPENNTRRVRTKWHLTPVDAMKRCLSPGRLWYYSTKAYQSNLYFVAWLIKAMSFILFKSLLCVECKIENDIELAHMGVGCMVHPNVIIGRRVRIYHHVSIAAETYVGSPSPIIIEDDVVIGMHAILLGNNDGGIRIGKGAVIGAGAIVNRDVPAGAVVLPLPSRPVKMVNPPRDR